jgi:cytochrome c-type biogenesis protein CcmH/NrfF
MLLFPSWMKLFILTVLVFATFSSAKKNGSKNKSTSSKQQTKYKDLTKHLRAGTCN